VSQVIEARIGDEARAGHHDPAVVAAADGAAAAGPRSRWRSVRDATGAVLGTVLGIAPHLLHHVGLLAGAALFTGASGNVVFYALGLLLSVPMLRRLHRRFRTRWAPAIAVAVFTGLFTLSALVIGPAISGGDDAPVPSTPTPSPTVDHRGHH
jgi:hypothetical protein